MLTSRQMTLKPLLDSKGGIHLTVYLVNRGNLIDIKSQIRVAMDEASEWLGAVMTSDERKKFLEPLDALLHDARIFKQMKGNIGLFKNETLFRVLNIPVDIEQSCQVATSFHVKPLLRWLQGDQDFLLLGLEKEKAFLYFGNGSSLKLVDSILFPETFKSAQTFNWLNEWILYLTKKSTPKLFVAGDSTLVKLLNQSLTYNNTVKTPIAHSFKNQNIIGICQNIRRILKSESNKSLEKALFEFKLAEEGHRAKKNIFQISKAVVQGKVRKLIVTDELNIFGKIDQSTGGLAIHPVDLDHEDDCILDDLAQMVLSQGGEVIIAKRNEIPKGRPILAILDEDTQFIEKSGELYEVMEERFG